MSAPLGQLDIKVIAPVIEAGTPTTVDILIRNPFDKPISILGIKGPGSSAIRETRYAIPNAAISQDTRISNLENNKGSQPGLFKRVLAELSGWSISQVEIAGITAKFPHEERGTIRIEALPGSQVEWNRPIPENSDIRVNAAENATVKIQLPPQEIPTASEGKAVQVIAPGGEAIASFDLITTRWLLFKPLEIKLHAQVEYQVNDLVTSQVVPVSISIKAPLKAVLIGSNLGAVFGFMARQIKEGSLLPNTFHKANFIIGMIGALVTATIATVAFARKEPAQGFITIEDFYGGFLVGALIGYFGTEYFEKVIGGDNTTRQQ